MGMSKKQCPFYQGLCGLDEKEQTLCYSDAPYCSTYLEHITKSGKAINCVTDDRFELIAKYKQKLIETTNIESSPEEMKIIDNILFRFWQMGWLDKLEEVKPSAKQMMWNALYAEEEKYEKQYAGTEKSTEWFTVYRPWLQTGFEIGIHALNKYISED